MRQPFHILVPKSAEKASSTKTKKPPKIQMATLK